MSKFLNRIEELLSSSRSTLTPLPELFPPVDLDHARKAVDIERRAEENGQKELPLTDAHSPDAVELDIQGRLQEVMSRYLADYDQQVRLIKERFYEYGTLLDLHSINSDCQKMVGNLKAQADVETNDLYRDSETLKNKANEIKHFRRDNLLEKRLPHYPENPLMKWAVLAVLVVLEIVINFLLIRESGDMATVVGNSTIYSFVNVIIPYWLFSEGVRYVHHNRLRMAAFGWFIFLFFCVYAVSINLMMAHYRGVVIDMANQLEAAANIDVGFITAFVENQAVALKSFKENPFGLQDTFSWFLWLFGLALSVGGLISGYRSDDKYPGYGVIDRRYQKNFWQYSDAVEHTVANLRAERDEGSQQINRAQKALSMEFRKLPNMVESTCSLVPRCKLALDRLNTDFNLLVKEYRQANQKSRSSPAPEYFDEPVSLGRCEIPAFDVPNIERPQNAIDTLQAFSDQLHTMFDHIIDNLESTKQVLEDDYPFKVVN